MGSYEYLTNIPLDEALELYINALREDGFAAMLGNEETVGVYEAYGRVTSRAVYANICSPHYNAAAMDGVALYAEMTFGATETTPVTLSLPDFKWVDTGDPLPEGCDCVVMVEDIVESGGEDTIKLYQAAAPWQHVRQIGEDICEGDMLLPSFTEITPSAAGALAAGGVLTVSVLRKPVVGIIPTGDEIVQPSCSLKEGEIAEFNSVIFSGMLTQWGAVPKTYPIVKDEMLQIEEALKKAAVECDIVIINAGSSAGSEDYSAPAIRKLGKVVLHGIAIKPGKPAILGIIGSTPVIGAPGYPVSGIIVLDAAVRPLVDMYYNRLPCSFETAEAVLARRVTSPLKYREFVRAKLGNVNGKLIAVPLNRGAGVVTSFVKADALIDIPQNSEGIEAGERLTVRLLRPVSEIENALVITGSHDPLIDEAADLLRRKYFNAFTASSHVGSMGGIIAVKRGEAHMAGVHLLDGETGEYNCSFVKKHFPLGGAVLYPCVKRIQGFIVQKGNPKGVRGWEDISGQKLSYVNRQKGSGTRILCDYLIKDAGIEPSQIYGYGREEYTHTNVAALIAAKSADVGLGIYSAAKTYGLDFIPVCEEKYDLLIAEWAIETEGVKRFLDILTRAEFSERLTKLGGYVLGVAD